MKAYTLSNAELDSGSELGVLVSKAGYPSVTSLLNDFRWWDEEVEAIREYLKLSIEKNGGAK